MNISDYDVLRDLHRYLGGAMPMSKKLAVDMETQAYSKNPTDVADGWKLITPYTLGVKPFRKDNVIVLAIRGSADMRDVYADLQLIANGLQNSSRYREDRNYIVKLQEQYPQSNYDYYAVGHSLGGAICDLLLEEGLIKEAISYNPAVEQRFYRNTGNHRIYNEDDLLYNMLGKNTINPEVRPNKLSIFNRALNLTKAGKLKNAISAHLLSNFKGGLQYNRYGRKSPQTYYNVSAYF